MDMRDEWTSAAEIRRDRESAGPPFCPFGRGPCEGGCPSNAERVCITGIEED